MDCPNTARLIFFLSELAGVVGIGNWIVGGAFPITRCHLLLRQSWLFVGLRWGGLLLWLGMFVPATAEAWDPQFSLAEILFMSGAVALLLGTARKRVKKTFFLPRHSQSLFSDPDEGHQPDPKLKL